MTVSFSLNYTYFVLYSASYQLTRQPEAFDGFYENIHVSIPLSLGVHKGEVRGYE